jgi:ribosome-binding protein aMBF1 (putative translation factor)
MSHLAHQDWETVVFRKPSVETTAVAKARLPHQNGSQTLSSTTSHPAWKIEKMVDSDTGKPLDRVTKEEGVAIMQARLLAKMTQVQLAAKLNVHAKDLQEIESGKALRNSELLARIRRALGLKKTA